MEAARSRHAVKDDPPWKHPFPASREGEGGGNLAVSAVQYSFALYDCGPAEDPTAEGSNSSHSGCHGRGSYQK